MTQANIYYTEWQQLSSISDITSLCQSYLEMPEFVPGTFCMQITCSTTEPPVDSVLPSLFWIPKTSGVAKSFFFLLQGVFSFHGYFRNMKQGGLNFCPCSNHLKLTSCGARWTCHILYRILLAPKSIHTLCSAAADFQDTSVLYLWLTITWFLLNKFSLECCVLVYFVRGVGQCEIPSNISVDRRGYSRQVFILPNYISYYPFWKCL